MKRALIALVAALPFVAHEAAAEVYFRYGLPVRAAAPQPQQPEQPEQPGQPQQPEQPDAITLDRPSYAGERSIAFSTGSPTTTLPAPVAWSLADDSSPLPPGLSVSGGTGQIVGTPTQAGTFANIVLAGANGARSARSSATTIVIAGPAATAAEVLPTTVAYPGLSASRLNVTYLLGQYVPDARPGLAPGEAVEIAYGQPVEANGAHIFAIPNASSIRVDAEIDGGWQAIRTISQIGGNAAPIAFGRTVTATRYRVTNTGPQTLTNVTAGVAYGGAYAQLPVLTTSSRSNRLTVGQSFAGSVEVYTGPQGYGAITFKAPYSFRLTQPAGLPYVTSDYYALPAGLTLDSTTGAVSGVTSAPSWSPWLTGGGGMLFAQAQRVTHIAAIDADGYTAFAPARSFVVEAALSAATVAPVEIAINGTVASEALRGQLATGRATQLLPPDAQIIAKYAAPVSVGSARVTYSGDQAQWSVFVSLDQGAHWFPLTDTEATSGTVTTVTTESATGAWIMLRPSRWTTLKGLAIGKAGVYPAAGI